jgi:alpha-D-ribose 1-methylphosphonate 5-triphosphate synthase subunit PhnL
LVVYLSWNPGFKNDSYENYVARHTRQDTVWLHIVNQITLRVLGGLCKCVFGTFTGYDKETVEEVCFYTYLKDEIKEKYRR